MRGASLGLILSWLFDLDILLMKVPGGIASFRVATRYKKKTPESVPLQLPLHVFIGLQLPIFKGSMTALCYYCCYHS